MIEALNNIADKWFAWELAILWQVAVLIAIVWVIDLLIRKWAWPQVRYALWLLVLVKLILPPTLTSPTSFTAEIPFLAQKAVKVQINQPKTTPAVVNITKPAEFIIAPSENVTDYAQTPIEPMPGNIVTQPAEVIHPAVSLSWKAYAFFIWLVGIVVLSTWLIIRLTGLRREHLKCEQQANLPDRFKELLATTAQKLNLKKVPQVILTNKVCCPAVFGVFRPVLLMPADKLKNLTRQDVEHILLHELAHIKRGDLFIHAIHMILQIAYWFNPLLWLIRKQLQNLRELCCDATVAKILKEKTFSYRETLLETARQLLAEPIDPGLGLLGLFENSNWLVERLKWLERKTWKNGPLRLVTIFILVCLMSVTVLPMAKFDPGPPGFVLKGTVTDAETGKPIAGAKVGDVEKYADGQQWTTTDSKGNYEYKTWYEEHGTLAEADGYKRQDKGFRTKLFGSEEEKVINFELRPENNLITRQDESSKDLFGISDALAVSDGSGQLTIKSIHVAGLDGKKSSSNKTSILVEVTNNSEREVNLGLEYYTDSGTIAWVFSPGASAMVKVLKVRPNWQGLLEFPMNYNRFAKGGYVKITLAKCSSDRVEGVSLPQGVEVIHEKQYDIISVGQQKQAVKLLKTISTAKGRKQLAAAEKVAKYGRSVVPALTEMLQDDKVWAAYALGEIGPEAEDAVPALIKSLTQGGVGGIRNFSAAALGKIGPAAVPAIPALIETLKNDQNDNARMHAAGALGFLSTGEKEVIGALTAALQDEDETVRKEAAWALKKIEETISLNTAKQKQYYKSMPLPKLTAKPSYQVGATVVIRCEIPASAWRPDGNEVYDSNKGERPWYIRINGKDYGYRTGFGPFSSWQLGMDLEISSDTFYEDIELPPGKYRAAYVYKKIHVSSPERPQSPVYFDELVTNEVEFEMVDKTNQSQFKTTLPNGVTVELLGVCEHPSEGQQWWKPDGVNLLDRPYEKLKTTDSSENSSLYELVYRVKGSEKLITKVVIDDLSGSLSGPVNIVGHASGITVSGPENVYCSTVGFKKGPKLADISILVGTESNWKTDTGLHGPKLANTSTDGPNAMIMSPIEKDGKTYVGIAHSVIDKQFRVIALDKDGGLHVAGTTASTSKEKGMGTIRANFNLPLDKIKSIEFQTQDFMSVTFKNVSLKPNLKTDVQIEVASSSQEKDEKSVRDNNVKEVYLPNSDGNMHQILDLESGKLVDLPEIENDFELFGAVANGEKGEIVYDRSEGRLRIAWLNVSMTDRAISIADRFTFLWAESDQLPRSETIMARTGELYKVQFVKADENGCTVKFYPLPMAKVIRMPEVNMQVEGDKKQLSFGQQIEVTLPVDGATVGMFFLDFESGQITSPPPELSAKDEEAGLKWFTDTGVDVKADEITTGPRLWGLGCVFSEVMQKQWETITPEKLLAEVNTGHLQGDATGRKEFPAVFIFKTREGGIGLLQIIGFSDNPKGIKIRYKMLQNYDKTSSLLSGGKTGTQNKVDKQKVYLPDLESKGVNTVLDLASGQMLSAEGMEKDRRYFEKLGKGDLVYEYAQNKSGLLCLRGAKMQLRSDSGLQPTTPEVQRAAFDVYVLKQIPCQYQVTTAEGHTYEIKILSIKEGDDGGAEVQFWKSENTGGEAETQIEIQNPSVQTGDEHLKESQLSIEF